MKRLYIFLLLLLLPTILIAQYNVDGRRIWPNTIDSTKFSKDRSAVIGPGVIGGVQMYDATFGEMWFWVDWDSGATAVAPAIPGGEWQFGADNYPLCVMIGTEPAYKCFGFDADGGASGDDSVWVSFHCPSNYKDDTMELYLYGFHMDDDGAVADSLVILGTVDAISSTDTTKDLWDTGTAMTGWKGVMQYSGPGSDATADSILHIFNLDPEVENIDAGDLVRVLIYIDETRSDLDSGEEFYIFAIRVTYDILDVP